MKTRNMFTPRMVFSAIAALATVGTVSMLPARAADMDDEDVHMPTPVSYPYAAPGSIHLHHWTDATEHHLAPGSASEAREEMVKAQMMPMHGGMMKDDDMMGHNSMMKSDKMDKMGKMKKDKMGKMKKEDKMMK